MITCELFRHVHSDTPYIRAYLDSLSKFGIRA